MTISVIDIGGKFAAFFDTGGSPLVADIFANFRTRFTEKTCSQKSCETVISIVMVASTLSFCSCPSLKMAAGPGNSVPDPPESFCPSSNDRRRFWLCAHTISSFLFNTE